MCRVAHEYHLPVSTVYAWPHSDLVAAVASMVGDTDRCPGCGLTDDQQTWVAAELVSCPTCEDRDRLLESLRKEKSTAGLRARFRQLVTVEDAMELSSAARFTLAGAQRRAKFRQQRRSTPAPPPSET